MLVTFVLTSAPNLADLNVAGTNWRWLTTRTLGLSFRCTLLTEYAALRVHTISSKRNRDYHRVLVSSLSPVPPLFELSGLSVSTR